jgi:hypothetical protein
MKAIPLNNAGRRALKAGDRVRGRSGHEHTVTRNPWSYYTDIWLIGLSGAVFSLDRVTHLLTDEPEQPTPTEADALRAELDKLREAWRPIETAPRDGTLILVYATAGQHGLPELYSLCSWHEQAGFCICELRKPTHWMPLPKPPH